MYEDKPWPRELSELTSRRPSNRYLNPNSSYFRIKDSAPQQALPKNVNFQITPGATFDSEMSLFESTADPKH
jgi:hypothetical protein